MAAATDFSRIFSEGLPMKADGTFDEPAGIVDHGLVRLRGMLRAWMMDAEHLAIANGHLETYGSKPLAPDLSYADMVAAYLPRHDDAFLTAMMRCRRFLMDDVLHVVLKFTQMFRTHPRWAEDLTSTSLRGLYAEGYMRIAKNRTPSGALVGVLTPANADFGDGWDMDLLCREAMLLMLWMADTPAAQKSGIVMYCNYQGFTMSLAYQAMSRMRDPAVSKDMKELYQDTQPNRVRHMLLVDTPWYFGMVWAVLSVFLPKKIRERVTMGSSRSDKLAAIVPHSVLPAYAGGDSEEPENWWIDHITEMEAAGWTPLGGWPAGIPVPVCGAESPADTQAAAAAASGSTSSSLPTGAAAAAGASTAHPEAPNEPVGRGSLAGLAEPVAEE